MKKPLITCVPVLVDRVHPQSEVSSVVFSPCASSAIVAYEDKAPEFHDLRIAGLRSEMADGSVVELSSYSRIDKLRVRDPLRSFAYRPGRCEVALCYRDDVFVYRVNPVSGEKYEPVFCQNPVCLAFDSTGEHLAVASQDGIVTVFRFTDSDEAEELRQVSLPSTGRALIFDETSKQLLVACENNSLVEFSYLGDFDTPMSRGLALENGAQINAMQTKAIAYSELGLLAYAGVGDEVWLASSQHRCGTYARLKRTTRVRSLQFAADGQILATTDGGVRILSFKVGEDGLPAYLPQVTEFNRIHDEMPMVGAYHYGNQICVASVLPPE